MIINTKYNIGDKVWTIIRNEFTSDTISCIGINIGFISKKPTITYGFSTNNDQYREEKECFSSKEEFIKGL